MAKPIKYNFKASQVTVRLSDDLKADLERLKESTGRSMQDLITFAIIEYYNLQPEKDMAINPLVSTKNNGDWLNEIKILKENDKL